MRKLENTAGDSTERVRAVISNARAILAWVDRQQ
jgi:hypothetical protein